MDKTPDINITDAYVQKFIEELNRKEKEKQKLIENYDYINWLEKFTESEEHSSFASDTWLYFPEKISVEDNANVDKLDMFFEVLQEYCETHLIETSVKAMFSTNVIHIMHNNIGYEVGLVVGQGAFVYVSREEINENSIEFSAIMNNVPPKDYEAKAGMLDTLDFLIATLKEKDVPQKNIINIVEKHYN